MVHLNTECGHTHLTFMSHCRAYEWSWFSIAIIIFYFFLHPIKINMISQILRLNSILLFHLFKWGKKRVENVPQMQLCLESASEKHSKYGKSNKYCIKLEEGKSRCRLTSSGEMAKKAIEVQRPWKMWINEWDACDHPIRAHGCGPHKELQWIPWLSIVNKPKQIMPIIWTLNKWA